MRDDLASYQRSLAYGRGDLHRHYLVPKSHAFAMGDNRPNSNDSRYWAVTGGPGMGKGAVFAAWLARREAAGDKVPRGCVRLDANTPIRLDALVT